MITVKLNLRVKPKERQFLEKILHDLLASERLGVVDAAECETFYNQMREITGCSIVVKLHQFNRKNIERAIILINRLRMPKGSTVHFMDKQLPLGSMEGLALYINGRDLPKEIYQCTDVNVVATETKKSLEGIGTLYDQWVGDKYTAFYYYGASYQQMRAAILSFTSTYPLCKDCKIEQIA